MFLPEASSLKEMDPAIFDLIQMERKRQEDGLELIASENYTSPAVLEAQGSVLTNKYAEGYPQKRYYGGCEHIDRVEQLAIDRVCKLFGASYANVQPHSGSQANMAVYFTVLNPGDKILGMELGQGGHLTHGSPVNFSGRLFQTSFYGLDLKTELLDYNRVSDMAKKERPKLIVAGASAYPRQIHFSTMKEIADSVGAHLMVDMAHIAGLVAAQLHPDPVGVADFVTSTTHKTLRGPRGGIILADKAWEKKINSNIFPGIQGGPLEHIIAAKAVAFQEALSPSFKDYQKQVVANAKVMAETLLGEGLELVSGGTDNHLILVKTLSLNLSGKEAEHMLEEVGITCNKNMVPNDPRSPFVTSGIRLGTPALTTRGLKENEVRDVSRWMAQVLKNPKDTAKHGEIKGLVRDLCRRFPVYPKM